MRTQFLTRFQSDWRLWLVVAPVAPPRLWVLRREPRKIPRKPAQLLSAPLWGRFSDRWGRRPALLIALSASTLAYVVFAYATSIPLLFLSRIVQGAGGGTVGVIQAYVADALEPEERARGLGW